MSNPYNKAMIQLVYEIRRRIESEYKPGIKFANPDLLTELVIYYRDCRDAILRALIKELMMYAGPEWELRLHDEEQDIPKQILKSYRGVVSLEESPVIAHNKKPDLIYRGQVVKR
jgi:hypothetical protein